MKIARVFPRRTKATPTDDLAYIGRPNLLVADDIEEVHISVTFTWDLPEAEKLVKAWKHIAPVKIGGPATGQAGGDFTPGMYLREGSVITSRGCKNRCPHCFVWRRENGLRELPITEGYNLRDDNILSCSEGHIKKVFQMLSKQEQGIIFSGGFEAKLLKPWHIEELLKIRVARIYCAYDTPDDKEPLFEAGKLFKQVGYKLKSPLYAYALCGYKGDTFEKAEKRFRECMEAGFLPYAMLYRDSIGKYDKQWKKFSYQWSNPATLNRVCKEYQ